MDVDHAVNGALTTDPTEHPAVFARAFNTGDGTILDQIYEPDALFVLPSGEPVSGEARRAANDEFLRLGLPITVTPRRIYVQGDLALLIVDWVIDGRLPDGEHVHISATATDVARRGADGYWRYVIDNPFGIATGSGEP
ncbi:DUF4440 domain-containing protein [Micromonospora sp. NPDC007271]|uniref:YybH family protein n=1 Tax=Micromonospora sp. NPDC007271 TaxID=3154587 RepID=UPI0033E02CCA